MNKSNSTITMSRAVTLYQSLWPTRSLILSDDEKQVNEIIPYTNYSAEGNSLLNSLEGNLVQNSKDMNLESSFWEASPEVITVEMNPLQFEELLLDLNYNKVDDLLVSEVKQDFKLWVMIAFYAIFVFKIALSRSKLGDVIQKEGLRSILALEQDEGQPDEDSLLVISDTEEMEEQSNEISVLQPLVNIANPAQSRRKSESVISAQHDLKDLLRSTIPFRALLGWNPEFLTWEQVWKRLGQYRKDSVESLPMNGRRSSKVFHSSRKKEAKLRDRRSSILIRRG